MRIESGSTNGDLQETTNVPLVTRSYSNEDLPASYPGHGTEPTLSMGEVEVLGGTVTTGHEVIRAHKRRAESVGTSALYRRTLTPR